MRSGVMCMVGIVAFCVTIGTVRSQDLKSLEPKDGLVCLLVNKNSGRCLSTAGRSAEPGARIVQGPLPEEAGPTERWKLIATGNAFRLRNEQSGFVLEIGSANLNKGVQAIQWHDHETRANQHWTFEPYDDFYLIRTGHSDQVLGIAQGQLQDGARAIQWNHVRDVPDQLWELRSTDPAAVQPIAAPLVIDEAQTNLDGWLLPAAVLGSLLVVMFAFALVALLIWRRRRDPAKLVEVEGPNHTTATSISMLCPGCKRILKPSATSPGKKVRCSKCGAAVLVPASPA